MDLFCLFLMVVPHFSVSNLTCLGLQCVRLCVCCVSLSLQTQTWLDSFSVYFPLSPESLSLCLVAASSAVKTAALQIS